MNEGVNESEWKSVETNHPYERGKSVKWDVIRFKKEVIGVTVGLDSKCNSDYDNDYLVVSTCYEGETMQQQNYDYKNRSNILTNSLVLTGKLLSHNHINKVYYLLGNIVQVDFNSSGQAKSNLNLNKWGYRLILKPIYSFSHYPLENNTLLHSQALLTIAIQDLNHKYLNPIFTN